MSVWIPVGYLYKKIVTRPDWLSDPRVVDLHSVSGCFSAHFCDYTTFWRHNGFWLFDDPRIMREIAAEEGVSLTGMTLFYYEAYAQAYDEKARVFVPLPEFSPPLDVRPPAQKSFCGVDVVSFQCGNSPECSPLSCNYIAAEVAVNEHCLFADAETALAALRDGTFDNAEPGPHRVLAVYRIDA